MELRHLRYFVAVADAGGVSRAAARLNISQPALSRQIRDLETELGLSLFDRRGGRLVLTGEGEDLLARGRQLLTDADSFRERAGALRGGDAGILRVGVAPLTLESLLPPFLIRHQRRHPGIEVRLAEDSPSRLFARLERGELSLAVSFPGHEGLGSRLLFPLCALAVMSVDHRLGRRATLDVAEVAKERLLLLSRQFLTRQWFDTACQRAHLRPKVLLESTAPHALIALARVGYGIAIVPSHTEFDRRGLRTAPLVQRGKALGAWAAITWDPHRFQPPFVERFVDELAAYSRRSYPGRGLMRGRILTSIPKR
ncbi:MAG: LysR family transcriptional regulator [Candidatus Rokubacteria bacterium]|nr:LysR family transcriptional regulator [Candidatus Rokubacteria bacterium]